MTVSMVKNIAAVFLKIKVGNALRISFLNLCLNMLISVMYITKQHVAPSWLKQSNITVIPSKKKLIKKLKNTLDPST